MKKFFIVYKLEGYYDVSGYPYTQYSVPLGRFSSETGALEYISNIITKDEWYTIEEAYSLE
jgi:hypothetical protein